MVGRGLRHRDQVAGRDHIGGLEAEVDLHHFSALLRAAGQCGLHRGRDLTIAGLGPKGPGGSQAHAGQPPLHARGGVDQQRGVDHAPRQWTGVVETPGQRDDARQVEPAVGRLEPHHPAVRGRYPHRTSGVAPPGAERESGCHRDPRAGAGAAWRPGHIPGIARGRERIGERGRSQRELVGRQLAQDHRARLAHARHLGRLDSGQVVLQDPRAGGRRAEVVEVFEGDRNPVQGAPRAASGQLRIRAARLRQRALREHRVVGVQLWVELGDAVEQVLRDLDRRQLPRRDGGAGLLEP